MAPAQQQGTTVVQPAHECAVVAPPLWRLLSGRAPPWCSQKYRYAVAAQPPGQCATVARAPTALRRHGAGSVAGHHRGAALCLRGASSVAERHRDAANVHVRHRGAILRAERHRGAAQTALRRRGANSVTWHRRGAVNVRMRRCGATFRVERHRGAAQTVFVRQPGHGVSSRPIHEAPWRGLHLALRQPP